MTINPILNSISAVLAQQSSPVSVSTSADIAAVSTQTPQAGDTSPASPLLENANLLSASTNFAQLGSLLQSAQQGTEQVGDLLGQLQALAQQAANGGDGTDLSKLSGDFQQLLSQLGQTVSGTTFGGTSLIGGAGDGGDGSSASPLPDLSTQSLFGGNTPDISTPQDAAAALNALAAGQAVVESAGSSLSNLLGQVDFAAASVGTVIANGEAASSTLSESDLEDGGGTGNSAGLLSNPSASVQTQTANLPEGLLSLLQQ